MRETRVPFRPCASGHAKLPALLKVPGRLVVTAAIGFFSRERKRDDQVTGMIPGAPNLEPVGWQAGS
jgi:hypothetical protein